MYSCLKNIYKWDVMLKNITMCIIYIDRTTLVSESLNCSDNSVRDKKHVLLSDLSFKLTKVVT